MSTHKYQNCNELPIVRHPSSGSGDCEGLESAKLKAGQTSDWTLPDGAFVAKNPVTEDFFWQDEETELLFVTDDGELIELL